MNHSKATVFVIGLSLSGMAFADCGSYDSVEETINRINYEGATTNEHQYSNTEINAIYSDSSQQEKSDMAAIQPAGE